MGGGWLEMSERPAQGEELGGKHDLSDEEIQAVKESQASPDTPNEDDPEVG
jgi:hypothetical protein